MIIFIWTCSTILELIILIINWFNKLIWWNLTGSLEVLPSLRSNHNKGENRQYDLSHVNKCIYELPHHNAPKIKKSQYILD